MRPPQSQRIHHRILLPAICLLTLLIYGRAYDAGFVTDFTGLYAKMQGKGLADALQSFGFPSLMPLLNVVYWLLYKLCGLKALGWFLCAVVCSTITLVTFYKMVSLLAEDFGARRKATRIALLASALVLCSPYQVEAMIWKVGLGHLMSVLFFMLALYQLLLYLRAETTKHLIGTLTLLMLSLFCFEWGLVFPAMAAVLLIGYLRLGRLTITKAASTFVSTLIPVVIYFILTKLVLGSWLGHYDMDTEMRLDVGTMASTILKYFIKSLGLVHFYPNDLKQSIYMLADKSWVVVVIMTALVAMIISGYWRGSRGQLLAAMGLSCALLGLVLVSGLYFHSLLLSENDRYGSLFIYFLALVVTLGLMALPRWLGYGLFLVLLGTQIFFQQKMVSQWSRSQDQVEKITDSFQRLAIRQEDKVLMLNLPENLCGTFMFRDFSGQNPLLDHLNMYGIPSPPMDLVAQYNVPYGGQAFTGSWVAKGKIRLVAREWGSWWWKKGLGVGKYETEAYLFEPRSKAMELQLKEGHTYTKIIYFDGESWQAL